LKQLQLIIAPSAIKDLQGLHDYIAADNVDAASRFIETLYSRFDLLCHQPGIGRKRDEVIAGYRSIAEGEYVIFYQPMPSNNTLEIKRTSNFAKQVAEIELGMKPPVVHVGNLSAQRDWTDVRDIVRAYWLATQHCTPGEVYVIGSGVSRTIADLLDLLLSMSKSKIEIAVDPARLRPSDVEVLKSDPTKFRQATGWTQEYSFEQTIQDLLDYWRHKLCSKEAESVI
jgi:plasmid stabilization system protein ParE